jgi:hypothetical protein
MMLYVYKRKEYLLKSPRQPTEKHIYSFKVCAFNPKATDLTTFPWLIKRTWLIISLLLQKQRI